MSYTGRLLHCFIRIISGGFEEMKENICQLAFYLTPVISCENTGALVLCLDIFVPSNSPKMPELNFKRTTYTQNILGVTF